MMAQTKSPRYDVGDAVHDGASGNADSR
jgi:hypothetical protein